MDSFIFISLLLLLLLLFFWLAIFVSILHNFQRHSYNYQVTEPTEKRDILILWTHTFLTKREDHALSLALLFSFWCLSTFMNNLLYQLSIVFVYQFHTACCKSDGQFLFKCHLV